MKLNKVYKSVLAGVLLAIFIMPIVAKVSHIYVHEYQGLFHSHSDETHSKEHNCDSCLICQFAFSVFTESDSVISIENKTVFVEQINSLYREKGYFLITYSNYLRAPPAMM